jgi:hypothetical protein
MGAGMIRSHSDGFSILQNDTNIWSDDCSPLKNYRFPMLIQPDRLE